MLVIDYFACRAVLLCAVHRRK